MKVCTFFGHRDCPTSIKPRLRSILIDLIENKHVDTFYVGNQGNFDRLVCSLLQELSLEYTHISYNIVLAYLPNNSDALRFGSYLNIIFPEGLETVPLRCAISWRNSWMLERADLVVSYVAYSWGGASKFIDIAKQKGKCIINLAEQI